VLDSALTRHARIWVHPLANTASTGLAPADLLRFLASLGHPATILDLEAPPA